MTTPPETPVEETPVTPPEGTTETPPEPTREELAAKLAETEKELQRARSQEGQVRSRREQDAVINRLEGQVKRQSRYLELLVDERANPDTTPEEIAQKRAALTEEEREALESERFAALSDRLLAQVNRKLQKLGIDISKHPKFGEANEKWAGATNDAGVYSAFEFVGDLMDETLEAQAKGQEAAVKKAREEGAEEVKRDLRDRGIIDLSLPRPSGGPGESDQGWLDRFADEVNGNIPSTPENRKRAKDLMDKGMRPQVRR